MKDGSTCVLVIIHGTLCVCANVGDSRGIMISKSQVFFFLFFFFSFFFSFLFFSFLFFSFLFFSFLTISQEIPFVPLSSDHKPDVPSEKERIIK